MLKYLIQELDIDESKVIYATFTGKASLVLREKGHNAITLHKLLYNVRKTREGRFFFIPKPELDEDYELIIVDEVSMVNKEIWELLLSHRIHVICLGDPF
ncbi:MAG: AAA family ATPase [Clostridia bacterium]|nr:AAA family ATPase [Clostridia bacterium]